MFKRDYVMRMIEQLGNVLVKVILNKDQRDYEQVIAEIHQAYTDITGTDPGIVHSVDAEQLIQMLGMSVNFESEKCLIIARLLKEETEAAGFSSDNEGLQAKMFVKSFILFSEGLKFNNQMDVDDFVVHAVEVAGKIQEYDLEPDVKFRLFSFYEKYGQYADAEDMLYELIDSGYPDINEQGKAFYNRLTELDDAQLVKGNLPREEVLDGLQRMSVER